MEIGGLVKLSVVIVNWNTRDELRKCLASIYTYGKPEAEVIVVDNDSSDGSGAMARAEFPQVKLIRNRENRGFAVASNQGIVESKGKYIFLLNPDSVVEEDTLNALVRFGDENPRVGIFGPKVLNPNGTLQYSCRRFPTLAAGFFRNTPLGRLFPKNAYTRDYLMTDWRHDEPREVDWVSGCAMVLRRKMLDEVGLLDEGFFMYVEDVDICYRARETGWKVAYIPAASVIHVRAKASDKAPNRMIREFHKSMYRFFLKHYAPKSGLPVRIIVPLGLFLRAAGLIARNKLIDGMRRLRGRRDDRNERP